MPDNNNNDPKQTYRELTVGDIDPVVEQLIALLQQKRVPSTLIVGTALLQVAVMQLQVNHKQTLDTIKNVVDKMFARNKNATMTAKPIIIPPGRIT